MNNFEVGDLVRDCFDKKDWIVSAVHQDIRCYSVTEGSVWFRRNELTEVFTFWDLAAAWTDAQERYREWHKYGIGWIWQDIWAGQGSLADIYDEYVRFNTPIPEYIARQVWER